jgi:hypothetical protein
LDDLVGLGNFVSLREAAMILLCHPARSLKQRTDPIPHDLFEKVAANLSVVTNGSAAKPESVRSGAAVGVPRR